MKVSLNWLKEFVGFNTEGEKVANLLNNRTMEVEKVFRYYSQKKSFENVVVGEIKSINAHPASDKFGIAEVYGGEAVGTKRIVFTKEGLDIKVGEKPLIATKGTVFENGIKIRDKAIFGIVSEAAFCSEKDLGLQLNASSIIKFPDEKIGRTAYDIFELNDTVLEFDLEPNRPDLFGILGFAYETAAILGKDVIQPEVYNDIEFVPGRNYSSNEEELTVKVQNTDLIPAYIAVKISGVQIKESNMDIKNKLIKAQIRPINNVVDLTNIVMTETSQPLHAFDASKLGGKAIYARLADDGETVVTLDGKKRELTKDDIVIAADDKIVALAGIMGGENSEIDENTTDIIVEAANFNMSNIRRTSRALSLRTDASTRFEKGLSPLLSILGIKRFLYLLNKYCGGGFKISCYAFDLKEREKPQIYEIKTAELCDFLGDEAVKDKTSVFLSKLGYEISPEISKSGTDKEVIFATPPYFRSDITESVNIYEDVFRIYGYDKIKSSMPAGILTPPQKNQNFEASRLFKNLLRCKGFTEIISPSLTGEKEIKISNAGKNGVLELRNPISADYAFFRVSIIPDILKAVYQNSKKYKNIKIFEAGKIYRNGAADDSSVAETNLLCGAVCSGIKSDRQEPEFYRGKGVVEFLLKESGIKKFVYSRTEDDPLFNSNASMEISVGKNKAGIFGEIRREILEEFKIESKVFIFELDLDFIKDFISLRKSFIPPNKYPEIEQDISIVADSGIAYASIEKSIKGFSGLIKNVRLADVYRGRQIEEGKISFLIRYDMIAEDRTLTMEEVNLLRDELLKELNAVFGISLRN